MQATRTHINADLIICTGCSFGTVLLLLLPRSTFSIASAILLFAVIIFSLTQIYRVQQTQQVRAHRYQRLGRKLVHLKRAKRRDEQQALQILDHIVNQSNRNLGDLNIWQRPLQNFSGDLAISCKSTGGHSYVLLADFTGHGIAAAMGATPVASIFQATAKQGMQVEEIVCELNNKLTDMLPSGFFCCAAIVKIEKNTVTICNAGLPEILIATNDGTIKERINSTLLPLGIEKLESKDVHVDTKTYQIPHQLYAFTDGLIETTGSNDECFDIEKLETTIASQTSGVGRLPDIQKCFESFAKGTQVNDDISIVEVKIC